MKNFRWNRTNECSKCRPEELPIDKMFKVHLFSAGVNACGCDYLKKQSVTFRFGSQIFEKLLFVLNIPTQLFEKKTSGRGPLNIAMRN